MQCTDNIIIVGTLDMLFGLWPYATFLCPTLKNSSSPLCLISVSRRERNQNPKARNKKKLNKKEYLIPKSKKNGGKRTGAGSDDLMVADM